VPPSLVREGAILQRCWTSWIVAPDDLDLVQVISPQFESVARFKRLPHQVPLQPSVDRAACALLLQYAQCVSLTTILSIARIQWS
jgi:hypothetical protein